MADGVFEVSWDGGDLVISAPARLGVESGRVFAIDIAELLDGSKAVPVQAKLDGERLAIPAVEERFWLAPSDIHENEFVVKDMVGLKAALDSMPSVPGL